MTQSEAHEIAKRIRTLIAREDAGDVTRAARRLRLSIDDVCHLERVLADKEPIASLGLLATVCRRYDADACWLLTGLEHANTQELSSEARLQLADLLVEVGKRIVAEHQARRSIGGPFAVDDAPTTRASSLN